MAEVLESGKWRKATGAAFDRILKPDRTLRRLQASERTMEKARARAARIRGIKENRESREYQRSVRRILRELNLSNGGGAWGRWHHVRQRKAPEKKASARKVRLIKPSGRRVNLPKYGKAIRDLRGRVAVFLDIKYLGLKSKGWRKGLAADHTKYCFRLEALEEAEVQLDDPISNVAETPGECIAIWNAIEPLEEGYRANAKVQVRFVGALPHFLDAAQRRAIVRDFGDQAIGRYGLGYTAAAHEADEDGDERNFHFHLQATTRQVVRLGDHQWAFSEEKLTEAFTPEGLKRMRAIYAAVINQHCRKAGLNERFTHQSYQDRGLDAFRTEKIGPARMAAHEAGEKVAVIERNRARIAANEAGVEAQFLNRKLVLQQALADAVKQAVEAAKAVQRFASVGEQIRAIADLVQGAKDVSRSRPRRLRPEVREAARSVLVSANHAIVRQSTARIASGCRQALLRVVERATVASAGTTQPQRAIRSRSVFPAHRSSIERVATVSQQAAQESARKPRKTLKEGLRDKVAAITKLAVEAQAMDGKLIRRMGSVREMRRGVSNTVERAEVLRGAIWHRPLRRVSDSARTYLDRIILAAGMPTRPMRSLLPAAADWLKDVERHARRGADILPVARRNHQMVNRITAIRALTADVMSNAANPWSTDIAASRKAVANVMQRVEAHRAHAEVDDGNGKTIGSVGNSESAQPPDFAGAKLNAPVQFTHTATVARNHPNASSGARTAREVPAVATAVSPQRAHLVAVFAEDMQRKPTGLVIWDDGSVRPIVARADSWGLSKADLASPAAKARLLPLYVAQELRFDRLETELKMFVKSETELLDPDRKFGSKLSKEARETLAAYDRSEILHSVIERVHREAWLRQAVESRKSQMTRRGIDWRAIDGETRSRTAPGTISMHHDQGISP